MRAERVMRARYLRAVQAALAALLRIFAAGPSSANRTAGSALQGAHAVRVANRPAQHRRRNCTNNLEFIEDLSIPDGTQLAPSREIVKEWKVRNSGTCNWNADYSVRLISGDALGAQPLLALVPARYGTEAVISIAFTTPSEPGRYSAWGVVHH